MQRAIPGITVQHAAWAGRVLQQVFAAVGAVILHCRLGNYKQAQHPSGPQRGVQGQGMLTVDETALLCWRLLETQGKCGCTWETFKEVPNELKQIVPVERRLLRVRKQDSTVVLTTYREYTESAARQLQERIAFDVVEALRGYGYRGAFAKFRAAVRAYYKQRQLAAWYAR